MMRAKTHFPALAALAALSACGHSPPTTLHVMVAIPPARDHPGYRGAPVQIGAVQLPPDIDRVEMLRQAGAGRYVVLDTDRWAALPSRLARQTLIEDLALRLPAGALAVGPEPSAVPAVTISLVVLSVSPGSDRSALTAEWTRACGTGGDARRTVQQVETVASGDMAADLANLLAQLADRIAADLEVTPPVCPPAR